MGAELRFDGRVAVVTGGGRGLGRAFARLLAARGAAVLVNDVGVSSDADRYPPEPDAAEAAIAVAAEIVAEGGTAVSSTADVADEHGARSVVDEALAAFGRLDIVINNAGIVLDGAFLDQTVDDLRALWSVHVGGAFRVTRAAWPHLAGQGYGRVVNVGSIAGLLVGVGGHSAYDAAKGGLAGMTRSLATEGAPLGIQVNGLLPTATTRAALSVQRSYDRGIAFEPEQVAAVAAWLAHEECPVSGRYFAAGAGRVGEVFTSAARGYQCPTPAAFTLEHVRDEWAAIRSTADAMSPATVAEYNAFRIGIYQDVVGS
ncbi:SDR family NAD(P)-dependent oxidoreductase [Streptosporangium sp. NPDC001681]|uniref:SDR family NAD(P)-dependent oxidoreductase n=1 Tax=Streptosporangium sp. NPDC001681 TaxID=3154395 RepID=UPI003319E0CC